MLHGISQSADSRLADRRAVSISKRDRQLTGNQRVHGGISIACVAKVELTARRQVENQQSIGVIRCVFDSFRPCFGMSAIYEGAILIRHLKTQRKSHDRVQQQLFRDRPDAVVTEVRMKSKLQQPRFHHGRQGVSCVVVGVSNVPFPRVFVFAVGGEQDGAVFVGDELELKEF